MNGAAAIQVEGVQVEEAKLTVVEAAAEDSVEVPWPLYKRLVAFANHTFDCVTADVDFEGDHLRDCNCGFSQLLVALSDEGLVDIEED